MTVSATPPIRVLPDGAVPAMPNPAATAPLVVTAVAAFSSKGSKRMVNEDAVLVAPPLLAVADGVGGRGAGEVAAALTVEALRRSVRSDEPDPALALADAVAAANRLVFRRGDEPGYEGMVTTLVAALIGASEVSVAHAGDSRAYLLHEGNMRRLTEDHSLVGGLVREGAIDAQRARVHPQRNVILRGVGRGPTVAADVASTPASPGDLLLLCSDGLTDRVEDSVLERELALGDIAAALSRLEELARLSGGTDDCSAVCVRLG